MKDLLEDLKVQFADHADNHIAQGQSAYMKNKFDFFGIKNPIRKNIQQPYLLKENLPVKKEADKLIQNCWKQPQREFQYFALDLAKKYIKHQEISDLKLFEKLILQKSWWDTVDTIASHLVAAYFKKFPETIYTQTEEWIKSGNIWLQRSAILFQLKYKKATDLKLLESHIQQTAASKEFFIQKAIGWILREYAYTDKNWVLKFVENNDLSSLSKREALKHF